MTQDEKYRRHGMFVQTMIVFREAMINNAYLKAVLDPEEDLNLGQKVRRDKIADCTDAERRMIAFNYSGDMANQKIRVLEQVFGIDTGTITHYQIALISLAQAIVEQILTGTNETGVVHADKLTVTIQSEIATLAHQTMAGLTDAAFYGKIREVERQQRQEIEEKHTELNLDNGTADDLVKSIIQNARDKLGKEQN